METVLTRVAVERKKQKSQSFTYSFSGAETKRREGLGISLHTKESNHLEKRIYCDFKGHCSYIRITES